MVLESKRFVKRKKKEKRKKWDRNQVTELLITKKPFKGVGAGGRNKPSLVCTYE
jgi:hypothetical protein